MPILFAIVFIGLALTVLGGSHYLLYFSIIHFFPGLSAASRHWLVAAFLLLPLSFVASVFLVRKFEDFATRAYYFLSGAWLGFLANFILASCAVWLLVAIFGVAGLNLNRPLVASLLFAAAAAWSTYGVYNAFHPRVKEIAVTLPNLPAAWRGRTIVQISDVHLGSIYREGFMRRLVDQANALKPDLVVITGDLFDGMDGDLNSLVRPLADLKSRYGSYFITGNHEIYLGADLAYAAISQTPVRILRDEAVDLDGLILVGLSYPAGNEGTGELPALERLRPEYAGRPNVLLNHAPVNIDLARSLGVNLQLSGHTHRGQIFPLGLITSWVYKGYDHGLHVLGNYTLYTSVGAGTWGPAMRTVYDPEITAITLR